MDDIDYSQQESTPAPLPPEAQISYAEPANSMPDPIQIALPANQPPDLPPNMLDSRTLKGALGVPELQMNHETLKQKFLTDGELNMRQQAANAVERAKSMRNLDLVQNTVVNLGRPLTLPESLMLQDMINKKDTNPNTVFEEGYAKAFMDNLQKQAEENPDGALAAAFRVAPEQTADYFTKGQDFKAHRETMLTELENSEVALGQQTPVGRLADFMKFWFPLYQNWKTQGLSGPTPLFQGMGTDFDKQAANWYNMPMAEFSVKFPAAMKAMRDANPLLTLNYIGAMIHQSENERFMNDFFPLIDVSTIYGGIKGAVSLSARISNAMQISKEARLTVQNYAKALEPGVTRAALTEATGNIQGAGVIQAAEDIVKEFQGKQVDSPLKPLHTAFVGQLQQLIDDTSPYTRGLGQETVNRLVESAAAQYNAVLDKVALTMKVDRLPVVLAFQKNYDLLANQVKADFPHLSNQVLDVRPRRDVLESIYMDIYLGDTGQTLFKSRAQAEARVLEQGLEGSRIVEAEGPGRPINVPGTAGGFRTEQGSTYRINANGTTTRTASKFRPGDAVKVTPESTPKGKGGAKSGFTPTTEWQEVPKDAVLPPGLEIKMDMASGKNHARIPPGKEAEFATAPKAAGPRTGATGKTTGRTAQYEGKTYYEVIGKDGSPGWIAEDRLTVTKPGPSQSARGAQPRSERTVYMDEAQARAIFPPTGNFRIIDHGNGTASLATPNKSGGYGIAPSQKGLAYGTEPGVGKVPIELFRGEDLGKGVTSYPGVHFGNKISEVLPGRPSTVKINQQGAGYYIIKSVPWDETNSVTRDLLLTHPSAKTPESMFNAYAGGLVGKLRTPEDTLSYLNNVARKVATFGPSQFEKIINAGVQEIRNLQGWTSWIPGSKANRMWKEWSRVMDLSWEMPHPGTGKRGEAPAFRDPGELNQIYLNTLHRSPSEPEVQAAFSYLRNTQVLDAFNKMNVLKQEVRQGNQTWKFGSLTAAKNTDRATGYKFIDAEGKRQTKMPGSGALMIVDNKSMDGERVVNLEQFLKTKAGKRMQEEMQQGKGNFVTLSNPHDFPMQQWTGNQMVDHVYSTNASPRDLDWTRIKIGQQSKYDYEHYIVQSIVHHDLLTGRFIYLGDRTLAGHNIPALARDVAKKIDDIRELLRVGDEAGALAYYNANKLPQSFEEIQNWFKTTYTEDGMRIAGKLSLHEPIKVVPRGKTTMDLDKEMSRRYDPENKGIFKDWTRERFSRFFDEKNYNKASSNLQDPFDIFTVRNEGTKANPIYKMGDLSRLDPMYSFQRAMSRAINGMYLDDYKIASIEHWIQQAKEYLTPSDQALAESPAYWFYNNENHWKSTAPVEIKNNLQTAAMQIRQFLGIQDAATTWFHQAAQKLADSMYASGNPMLTRAALLPAHLLSSNFVRDPFQWLRSVIFHPTVGLFAVPQLWVQASTYANIYGIAGPTFAGPGTKAATLYAWSRINRNANIMASLDAKASMSMGPGSIGFKPGQFTEATSILDNSGFMNVSREHVYRDSTTMYKFLGSIGESFLNAGSIFFEKGEKATRAGAFYTAYLEVRNSIKSTGPLTKLQAQDVLQRADLLAGNMSRASASSLNKGIFSIPTQFQTFPLRMAEQMLGSRLTPNEKMRLFGTYAILYGIPGAAGLAGFPLGAYINKWAQESGYVAGDQANSYINTAVTEGLPSLLLQLTTGNTYNIGERYSLQGFDVFKDVLRSDKTFLDIIGGAAYSKTSQFYASMDPFLQSMIDGIKGEGTHPFKINDAVDMAKVIGSVSEGARLYMAVNTGKWLSNKEQNMGDVTPANALFMTVFGLQPKGVPDMMTRGWIRNDEKQAQDKAEQIFIREMRRSFEARDQGDYANAAQYESRAYHSLRVAGYPEELIPKAMSSAARDYESMIARSMRDYTLKNVPTYRENTADDQYLRFLRTYYKDK